jgi:3-oxoacyl-[acyl-carrier protein] reductase
MMRARRGRIVLLSSVVGEMGNVGQTAYAATKAALLGVTRSLAREYASRNITVNAITPGFIETDMTAALGEEMRAELLRAIPLGRIGAAQDVAAGVVFLCSDEAGYITGQTLRINGGMYM